MSHPTYAGDPEAAGHRAAVEQNVRDTLDQVRKVLRHSTGVTAQIPLPQALERLAMDFQAAGGPRVEVTLVPDAETLAEVSEKVYDVIYRTTQEALTNAVRHGRAQTVHIKLEAIGPRLYLRISDDGIGAGDYTPGMGLSGMVSRVQELGGTLRFHTSPGRGFHIEVGVRCR